MLKIRIIRNIGDHGTDYLIVADGSKTCTGYYKAKRIKKGSSLFDLYEGYGDTSKIVKNSINLTECKNFAKNN